MRDRCAQYPINITGAFRHCFLWLASSSRDVVLVNPNGNKKSDVVIYCVHGTADRASAFSLIAERLLNRLPSTIKSIYLLSFDNRGQGIGIQNFAAQLKVKICQNGDEKVILWGHSRGGKVCAYFTEYLAKDAGIEVLGVYTFASPHGGSGKAMAPLTWISESMAQMQLQSEFVKDLTMKIKESPIPYYFYAAEKDKLVPLTSTYVEGREDQLTVLRCHGHLSMLSSWKLVEHLHKRIVGADCSLSLQTLKNELQVYIEDFKNTCHVFSGDFKLKILEKFSQEISNVMESKKLLRYPEAVSISDFIQAFLFDQTLLKGGEPISKALNQPLNMVFFQRDTTTIKFFLSLCIRYKNIKLPRKEGDPLIERKQKNRIARRL